MCEKFLQLLPKFEWFIKRWYGQKTVDYLKQLATDNKEAELSNKLNAIWFELPDDVFNIKENPEGWLEFLSVIEQ